MSKPLFYSDLPGLQLLSRGKVRDLYAVDDKHLLFVASDRISAFDVVMGDPIPDKGRILTGMSLFWFDLLRDVVPNHLVSADAHAFPAPLCDHADVLDGRAMLVRRLRILPIECIVRGYLAGSGWKEYQSRGTVCDISLPTGLHESDRLPHPIFTPSTKAESGHDINISPDQAGEIVGEETADAIAALSIALYQTAAAYALSRGIIIADTKFEIGVAEDDSLVLADEVLTPDSSRFWDVQTYAPGRAQDSFDKQYLRDWLETLDWNKEPPAPALPSEVVGRSRAKYLEAYRRITGRSLTA